MDAAKPQTLKRIPPDTLPLVLAGDLVMAKCPDASMSGLFKRYETILEHIANQDKSTRISMYKILVALSFGAYAKQENDSVKRKSIYELKNEVFLSLAKDPHILEQATFKYLISKRFLVKQHCEKCESENKDSKDIRWHWKHCGDCEIDRKFFNIMAIDYRNKGFNACVFLSQDQIDKLGQIKFKKDKLLKYQEEILLKNFHYNTRNLSAFEFSSLENLKSKFLDKA